LIGAFFSTFSVAYSLHIRAVGCTYWKLMIGFLELKLRYLHVIGILQLEAKPIAV
jgi:hypothetical protein